MELTSKAGALLVAHLYVMQEKEYGRDDWYRRTTWGPGDQEAFFKRLHRSRSRFHKAQYLRIQAYYLQNDFPEEALVLLRMVTEEFPEPFELASTFLQAAQCLIAIGKKTEAIEWYRKALEQEEVYEQVQTQAYLDLPHFVVSEERKDLYSEARDILLRYVDRLTFPVEMYRWNMCMALIELESGDREKAKLYARKALEESSREHSGMRYHPRFGLVGKPSERLHKLLEKIGA